jgi:hypothetical protein
MESSSQSAGIQVYARNPSTNVFTWTDGYVKSKNGCAGIYVITAFNIPVQMSPEGGLAGVSGPTAGAFSPRQG